MSRLSAIRHNRTYAHIVPLAAFMLLALILQIPHLEWAHPYAPWWREWPEQWVYPLQTFVAGALLIFFWKNYSFGSLRVGGLVFAVFMGVVGIGLWILPSFLYDYFAFTKETVGGWSKLGLAPREEGFDPSVLVPEFGYTGYWTSLILRFLRAVIIVSFVEEIFWRGFLMRFLLNRDGDYWSEPFGKPQLLGYLVTTGAFILAHQPVDYLGAFLFGSLMYWVAVRTKSLGACVVMHAVANLIMGIYALQTGEYGLW